MQDSPLKDIKIGSVTREWAKARQLPSFFKDSVGSTNDWAKSEAFSSTSLEQNIIVYLADHQTQGRGRHENKWQAADVGSCLFSSWSFYSEVVPNPVTAPRTGLALFKAAFATWPFLPWSLKAPNDLYLGDKKVAGLLLETLTQGDEARLIVGLGFNVTDFPKSISTATSLIENLPTGIPLLGEDYITFLDRLLFELTWVFEKSQEELNRTEAAALVYALNLRPGKTEKFIAVDADGTLQTSERTIAWSSL